jgi:hypothetical protein
MAMGAETPTCTDESAGSLATPNVLWRTISYLVGSPEPGGIRRSIGDRDATGTVCHELGGYAPFDVATGHHVSGTPTLAADPAHHTVTLRVASSVIGVYHAQR